LPDWPVRYFTSPRYRLLGYYLFMGCDSKNWPVIFDYSGLELDDPLTIL
jgi:hypothetical protein